MNRERALIAEAKYRAAHPGRRTAQHNSWYARNREHVADYRRQDWQRSGSGAHGYRVRCWSQFFDSLGNDAERHIASHVMLALSSFDQNTAKVVRDPGFDYNYLGAMEA